MKKIRVTVDIPENEHMYFKMACARLKMTLKDFMLQAAEQKLDDLEDEWLSSQVDEIKKNIRSGEESFTPWKEVKRKLGLDDLRDRT